ncbi:MAG: GNAT family N-acetyltransferase [Bdellovibrionales bacterium]
MFTAPKLQLIHTDEHGREQDVTPNLQLGTLEVKLASTAAEIDAAQSLRYKVFYEELGAVPTTDMLARKRDYDNMDQYCDHLLVVDNTKTNIHDAVVGTYRFIRKQHAAANGSWYSAGEYDISKITSQPDNILEVGRSCVHADYRTRYTMTLMWRAIAVYAAQHRIKTIFGCASFNGTDLDAHKNALSYLYYHHLAPPAVRMTCLPEHYNDMRLLPEDQVDVRAAIAELPPLIKGYINVGCFVGDGAYIDWQFNTTDVAIICQTDRLTGRYAEHYKRNTAGMFGAKDE